MTVALNNDRAHIPIAFKSVQLICSDFLSNLTVENMSLYISTVGGFCNQMAELNISLTAINLLMAVADFIANETRLSEGEQSQPSPFNNLWESVFNELKQLGSDSRYEVRNCSAQTLFKTVTTHAALFSANNWENIIRKVGLRLNWIECLKVIFPLLTKVREVASSAGNEELETEKATFKLFILIFGSTYILLDWFITPETH